MRLLFLYLLSVLFCFNSSAQKKNKDEFNYSGFYKKQLPLKIPGQKNPGFKESDHIQVIDWRADTTAVGFQSRVYYTIADIKTSFKNQLLSLINFDSDPDFSGSKVVVCLDQIWVTHHLAEEDNEWTPGIIWKIDCFKKNKENQFTYLCSLDTAIETESAKFSPFDLVPVCLQLSAEKIKAALHKPAPSAQYSDPGQFKYHFDKIPILNAAQKNKGLYMTYEQFLDNSPSAADFEIDKNKLTDGLFVRNSKGTFELVRNIWGYCDGENMFIKSGEKYFQLSQVNNTFYFIGAKHIRKSVHNDLGTDLFNPAAKRKLTKFSLPSFPFQLDITNGDIY